MDRGIGRNNGKNEPLFSGLEKFSGSPAPKSDAAQPWLNHGVGGAFIDVTPEMAFEWMRRNRGNRPLSLDRVEDYSRAMRFGLWKLTHQGVAFSKRGRLLDGQHRLHAIVDAGVTICLHVSWGLAGNTFDVIDTGRARTVADMLNGMNGPIRDLKRKSLVAAVAAGMMRGISAPKVYDKAVLVKATSALHEQITPFVEVLVKEPISRRAPIIAAFCVAARGADAFPGPRGGFSRAKVMALAKNFASLEFAGNDDPMRLLYKSLSGERASGRRRKPSAYGEMHTYAVAVTAIRAALEGKPIKRCDEATIDFGGAPALVTGGDQ